MNSYQAVSSHIENVQFGFLAAKDIRSISVKRITNPTTFDTLLHPVPGGLHDAALGSFLDSPCSTCHLTTIAGCTGHCGHIELPVPVYHVTFIDQLLRLLRGKCVYCHRFKLSRADINYFVCKLRLIRCGLVEESHEVEVASAPGEGNTRQQDIADSGSDNGNASIIERRNKHVKRCMKRAGISKHNARSMIEKNDSIAEARREVLKTFYTKLNLGKICRNCQGINPTYRKDRGIKIFRRNLSAKERIKMTERERRIQNPLDLLAMRQLKAVKHAVHSDSGVTDMDPSEEGEEDVEMQEDDGSLTVTESRLALPKKTSAEKEDGGQEYLTPTEVRAAMVLLFETEAEMMRLLYNPYGAKALLDVSPDMFFLEALVVPPNRWRLEDKTGDSIAESPKNSLYKAILVHCDQMRQISNEIKGGDIEKHDRRRTFDDLQANWVELQGSVNAIIDQNANPGAGRASATVEGVKQKLEKKQGLFRKNMMGKRVNFAARSVISPDPNIETNEIGVPPVFAMKLTYPEPVTNHNFYDMKEAVLNGPDKWPGAHAIENEFGQVIALKKKTYDERLALANQLLAPSNSYANGSRNKKVHRHLNNGDVVIMNRQPTLHKPSMMAHRARVLPGEKTIRMHYANCNTYNADFDGDEMNMHFPQNELARAEAMIIADTDHQYLSATAGKPLRGLIQDHISMGVWLTNRDMFFTRSQYQELLYSCLRPEDGHTTSGKLETIEPCILKPRPLWSGKQLITSVLKNIKPAEYQALTMTSKSSTSGNLWGTDSEEDNVIIKDGYLLCGIIDKNQIGPAAGGLINGIYESYGDKTAGRALSVIGRLLTKLLHMRAFSCGVEDLILTEEGNKARLEELEKAANVGLEVASKYVTLDSKSIKSTNTELRKRLETVLRDDHKQHGLDLLTNTASADISSAVTKACLPSKLIKPFPKNQMQAMTGSGAKGSKINANQISCNLGQQVLEGRRVPVMVSGRTLPCFNPFETSVRAGGYIVDRFLTGIRPQEYYFHMMAGREGLIDTAVKTSRSGYLQRCIVKGMEGLRVEYDTSVRDSDGSMVQFLYGEDGLDTTKQKYLTDFKFQTENLVSLSQTLQPREAGKMILKGAVEYSKQAVRSVKRARKGKAIEIDPVTAVFTPARHMGSTSESFYQAKKEYCDSNPDKLLVVKKDGIDGHVLKRSFEQMLDLKYLRSLVEPGEAVGVVAGQSIGEPSTQMTLNTFHLAGHSAKNVTLGIPRLREIVMTASANISTPSMQLHPLDGLPKGHLEQFAKGVTRLPLSAVLDKVTVTETIGQGVQYSEARIYKIRLDFYPAEEYKKEYAIKVQDVARAIELRFCPRLQKSITVDLKKKGQNKSLSTASSADIPNIGEGKRSAAQQHEDSDGDDVGGQNKTAADNEESDDDSEGDATHDKVRGRREDSIGYEEPEEEDKAVNEGLEEEVVEEDETYGGSPKQSRESSPDAQSNVEDEETLVSIDESSDSRRDRICTSKGTNHVFDFVFDDRKGAFCEITLEFPDTTPKVLMLNHIESVAEYTTIQVMAGIVSATYTAGKTPAEDVVTTDGSSISSIHEQCHTVDPNRIYTNDIAAMLKHYGVEACRATIVREMHNVFSGHGISVDLRHLNLIADTMTRGGSFTPFNRIGLKGNVSPFMKMSFETTVGFLKDAVLERDWDDLRNPSARIVVGRLGKIGTGAFDIMANVKVTDPVKDAVQNGVVSADNIFDEEEEEEDDDDDEDDEDEEETEDQENEEDLMDVDE